MFSINLTLFGFSLGLSLALSASAQTGKFSAPPASRPQSLGAPNHGKLLHAKLLSKSRNLFPRESAHLWGTTELISHLHDAANHVARFRKGSVLFVGDLSSATGGPLYGHNSHQSGRDADVAFYVMNSRGKPAFLPQFVGFEADGTSKEISWARFDDARNWQFVQSLITEKAPPVSAIFISEALENRLLAYAKKKRIPRKLRERAAEVMMSPADTDVHDDHYHIRIACPKRMRPACIDEVVPATERQQASATPKPDSESTPTTSNLPHVDTTSD